MAGRLTQIAVESLEAKTSIGRLSQIAVESLEVKTSASRFSQIVVEVLRPNAPIEATLTFSSTNTYAIGNVYAIGLSTTFSGTNGFSIAIQGSFQPTLTFFGNNAYSEDTNNKDIIFLSTNSFALSPNNSIICPVLFSSMPGFEAPSDGFSTPNQVTLSSTNTYAISNTNDEVVAITFTDANTFAISGILITDQSSTYTGLNTFACTTDPGINKIITFTSSNTFAGAYSYGPNDGIVLSSHNTFTAIADGTGGIALDTEDIISFIHRFSRQATRQRPLASQHITFTDHYLIHKINHQAITQSLTFSQAIFGGHSVVITPQTLIFVNTYTIARTIHQSIHHTLNLNQTLHRSTTYNRAIVQSLVFQPFYNKPTTIAGTYAIPQIGIRKVLPTCLVVLNAPSRTIVLPCPEFNDKQDLINTINIKRSQTGLVYTYARPTNLGKLDYTFILGRIKSLELRQFYIDFNSQLIQLVNWKGEEWLVYMTNNPLELTAKGRWDPCDREKIEVHLEFQGIKTFG